MTFKSIPHCFDYVFFLGKSRILQILRIRKRNIPGSYSLNRSIQIVKCGRLHYGAYNFRSNSIRRIAIFNGD